MGGWRNNPSGSDLGRCSRDRKKNTWGIFVCVCVCVCVCSSCVRLFVTPWTVAARLLCAWDFPGKNIGVGCHFLLQGSSWRRDWTHVPCTGRQVLYHHATWEVQWGVLLYTCWLGNPTSCRKRRGVMDLSGVLKPPFLSALRHLGR